MSLPTIKQIVGFAKDSTLTQVTTTDLSTYTSIEFRSEDLSLTLSSANASELEIVSTTNILLHLPAQSQKNRQYNYWLKGIGDGIVTDLGGKGLLVIREEP